MAALVTLVVARAANGVIGAEGAMPWRIPSEMAGFKSYTMGKPVLMGRKTWDSFPRRPLPGRANIILSRDASFRPEGAWIYAELAVALAAARSMTTDEVCVIGGGQIYNATLPIADRIRVTEIGIEPAGDTHFTFDEALWREVSREAHDRGPKDAAGYVIRLLERR